MEGFENFGISAPAQNPDHGDAENRAFNHNNNKVNENVWILLNTALNFLYVQDALQMYKHICFKILS